MPDRREYLFSPNQIRLVVALGTLGMAVAIVALLLLGTSQPQGNFQALDGTQFQQHLADTTASISGYEMMDDGRARIDIGRAMELVAERGVQDPGFYVAGAAPATGTAADAADGTEATEGADAGAATQAALPDGEGLFASTCAACHQASGQGLPGAFPPLAGHVPTIYAADRDLLIEIVTFGMQGPIQVDGMTYNGLMPSHIHLADEQIAAILDYITTAWGNEDQLPADYEPYTADDVAAIRGEALSFSQVHDNRTAAGLE